MKRIIVWVVLLAGVVTTFNACNEEPDPIPAIVGTWSRTEYEFTDLPASHSTWEEYTTPAFFETGYTFVFKADGTYTRTFSPYLSDQGTWELDGTKLTISPDDPDDLDFMEDIGFLGPQFDVEGEITEVRLTLSGLATFELASNAAITAAGGNSSNVPDEDDNGNGVLDAGEDDDGDGVLDDEWKPVDVTLLTKFNKLN
jgi:hypothetical protein